MADVIAIIVGINGWQDFTLPAIQSIRRHEPDIQIVVVDAVSKEPYPQAWEYSATVLRLNNSPSYAYAINEGIKAAGKADWYLILNNDVYLNNRILPEIETLAPEFIYGRQIIEEQGHRWLGLWLALISRQVWERVGEFDERFLLCGFEDADYCIRAKQLGIDTLPCNLPFTHFWGKTRWDLPEYRKVRLENIDYLESKHGVRLGDGVVVTHD